MILIKAFLDGHFWHKEKMKELGIPLAKQGDIEGAMQNVLPNLPSSKEDRWALYRLMGYDAEFIDIIEALYKQFYKFKSEYRAPSYDVSYIGYR